MTGAGTAAPPWDVVQWFNTERPLVLDALRGRVIVLGAFQMLCPGCVEHSIPQLKRVHDLFPSGDVAVIGLHTVFEHHDAMGPTSLRAFLHEYRVGFPVGIDRPGGGGDPTPLTMRAYGLQGTPTTILIDRDGRLRRQTFGHLSDLQLGAEIMALIGEGAAMTEQTGSAANVCSTTGCEMV
ncbi:TlpA disulfide reductase family protein [Sphingosinicella sp. BN140058]|uniref:TlpA disulfide reductase family protein n=1 Tax=Sphingosinicella sp. BN140058 TaxID=1892855 RepID=UPI0010126D24|nr:TlpA disulfide reductase family protein [Sphingosinicella sp. BN140058]QAY78849.1 TlpA family protein disulfide reductase [Sphingosinicella sp. BN140058]